ncbi:MAG: DUF5709 domain-containing protein [Nocardioides sp.]|nr:DUF5709 domain-containing protein [Nocardioides sp.]
MSSESESYGDYSVDDEDQLQPGDSLSGDDVADILDRGYSPPENYSAGQGFGNTPYEEALGESLEQRLRQEEPEPDPYSERVSGVDDGPSEADEFLDDGEVGDARAGRLVDPDQGQGQDVDSELIGSDVGIDGAGASAEEAAMHVVPDRED